jgi:hypothetical protein
MDCKLCGRKQVILAFAWRDEENHENLRIKTSVLWDIMLFSPMKVRLL